MSTGPPLHSNHINYLIWRYLQEAGYEQTAARLQRDWESNPNSLPFAHKIRTHALVSLVQKGLLYHEVEASIDQNGNQRPVSPSMLYFGPESEQAPPSPNGRGMEDEAICTSNSSPRPPKHRRESVTHGYPYDVASQAPASKRTRHSENSVQSNGNHVAKSGDSMDVEPNGHASSHPAELSIEAKQRTARSTGNSPARVAKAAASDTGMSTATGMEVDASDVEAEAEADADADDDALQVQPTVTLAATLTNGCSVGVQSDKVAELGPETTILRVPDKNVTHTQWNPCYPQVLATGGDALCRIWSLPKEGCCKDLDENDTAIVTSMAWSPDGEYLAVAKYAPTPVSKGKVTIWTKEGAYHDQLPGGQDWVLNLAWNQSGTLLLGIAHSDTTDSTVMVWDINKAEPMLPFELDTAVLDATWKDDRTFLVCGKDLIGESVIGDNQNIEALRDCSPSDHREWSKVCFDPITRTTAIAAQTAGDLAIIDSSGSFRVTTKAHEGEITALIYQPMSNPAAQSDTSPRLLATSSYDGTIKVWDARHPFTIVHTLKVGRISPVMAMSFTPDGYLVAAASWNRVLFWHAESGGIPKATWRGKDGEWLPVLNRYMANGNDRIDSEMEDESDVHSLSWDADGGKLAFALKNQVAIINFHR